MKIRTLNSKINSLFRGAVFKMPDANATAASSNELFVEEETVYGHNKTQTENMKWLRIKDIYPKLLKEGDYDIGGTYHADVADYWFLFSTDHFGDNFMLHLFVGNRHESSFTVQLSNTSEIVHLPLKRSQPVARSHLPLSHKSYEFKKAPDNAYNFVKSFSFSYLDVEQLKDRELLISVRVLPMISHGIDRSIVQNVKLNHDLGVLLKDPIHSDFTMESSDGHQFAVHRVVLAAHSEVFKAMLKEETAESQNNKVTLHFSKDDLECLLQFIYTGSVAEMAARDCRPLLMLADQYNLPGLSKLAQNALRRQLNTDNAIEMAVLGDMYNSDLLKTAAFKYLKQNPEVLQSESWKQLRDPRMIKNIFEFIYSHQ